MKKPLTPKYIYNVNGKKYRTLQEIANAEGVSQERIRQKMDDPFYEEYQRFFPDGSPAPKSKLISRRKHGKPWNKSCTINGVEYESQDVAAEILGLRVATLRYRIKSSNFPEYVSTYHKKIKVEKRGGCSVAGVEYRSILSASIEIGISHYEMMYRLASLDYPDYISSHIAKKPSKTRKYKKRKVAGAFSD